MKKINIRVLPRSSKNEIVGEMADRTLKVKLTAPPVDGEANKKLIELLAKHFGVSKSKIKIVRGLTSKNKVIEI
ncbi:YggU family protein [Candidatus Parcubacteria bacterium]|nr:MAG: YggU family protein [Candidatus Parcubacteria bacterium]